MTGQPARQAWIAAAMVAVLSAPCFYAVYVRLPVLYDTDAYYHLAVARLYAERGIVHTLDWARFSVMHDGFGDKDFLFHVLLAPFAAGADPSHGGVVALALSSALVAAALAHGGVAATGRWGLVVPLLVFGGSADFALRLVRLRPEILSLLLILVGTSLASARRLKLLGAVACVYTLGYTAFHAFLGLCVLFFLYVLWVERRAEWRLVVYPMLGIALGLVVHPHFPDNVRVWVVQNFDFFARNETRDAGTEILSRTTRDTLLLNLGWWMGLLVLWRSRVGVGPPAADTRARDFTLLAALAFGLLYVFMARFITYLVPLTTLALVRCLQAAGQAPGRFVRLPRRGRLPFAAAMAVCLLAIVPTMQVAGTRMAASAARIFRPEMRADWEAFARALPEGAKVAAPWAATHAFVFWAPQGRYLNVLDPVFMAARDPDTYRDYMDLFEGREPDLPLLAASRFDSDFFADDGQYRFARSRLVEDPRVARLRDGIAVLYRFLDGANTSFLLDWRVMPPDAPVPPPLALVTDAAAVGYPRAATARERAREGYVDGRRLGTVGPCVTFARVESIERPQRTLIEVSPYGHAEIFVDDRLAAVVPSPRAAVLGRGVVLPIELDAGLHRLTIRTCRSEGQLGFYALVRPSIR